MAAVALGVARTAIDTFVAIAETKTPLFAQTALREWSSADTAVGRAEAGVRSSRVFLDQVVSDVWQSQCQGLAPTGITREFGEAGAGATWWIGRLRLSGRL